MPHPTNQNLRAIAKSLVPPVIWNLLSDAKLRAKKSHSANELDLKVERYLNYRGGYYVELGAADGIGFSNTLLFEMKKGWSGILIEPSPSNFLKCIENRSSQNKFFCNACTSFEYTEKFVEMIYAHYMSIALGVPSDISAPEDHALAGEKYLATDKERTYRFGAEARPLNDLLIEAGAPKLIDFLSLDVEGVELEVLKGIDHKAFQFKLMCIETRSPERVTEYLRQFGYYHQEQISHHDHLYLLQ
jgi:FkbM family methyltransferase